MYWRMNLTLRQMAPLVGVSADRVLDRLAPLLANLPIRRPRKDTVYNVNGTLVATRDRSVAASSKNYGYRGTDSDLRRSAHRQATWGTCRGSR